MPGSWQYMVCFCSTRCWPTRKTGNRCGRFRDQISQFSQPVNSFAPLPTAACHSACPWSTWKRISHVQACSGLSDGLALGISEPRPRPDHPFSIGRHYGTERLVESATASQCNFVSLSRRKLKGCVLRSSPLSVKWLLQVSATQLLANKAQGA